MGEIKKKLNIKKITLQNVFLLLLMMCVMAIIGLISKSMPGSNVVNSAHAQSCWTPPGGGEGGEGGSQSAEGATSGEGSCSGCDSDGSE